VLLAKPVEDDADLAEALALLRASQGMVEAKRTVRRFAADARAELDNLPDLPGRLALLNLVEYTADRHG
jgi:heptaprenyl diphosphate synthase